MDNKLWDNFLRHNKIVEKEDKKISVFDGLSKQQAIRNLHKHVDPIVKGFFKDEYWKPIQDVWKKFTLMDLDYDFTGAEYYHDKNRVPIGKRWGFEVDFINNRDKKNTIKGVITAAGAGSVKDPLDRYDVTITMS